MSEIKDIDLTTLLDKIKSDHEHAKENYRKDKKYYDALQEMKKKIEKNKHIFDAEDIDQLDTAIHYRLSQMKLKMAEIEKIENLQKEKENLYIMMGDIIQQRSKILEQDNDCLAAHPEMTKYFAKKQIKLKNMLSIGAKEEHAESYNFF